MHHYGLMAVIVTWLSVSVSVLTSQTEWRPLKSNPEFAIGSRVVYNPKKLSLLHSCSLHKAVMDQQHFQQYVQYKRHIADMKEFTLCAWHKLHNFSTSQPIFSYILPHTRRTILSWVTNTPMKSYYMLAVNGHVLYRIYYPLKLYQWYHMCQSWNGKTGEWQLWLNGERVGRGYYNLMVGKIIKSGGIAVSGQEQTAKDSFAVGWKNRDSGIGFQGEITLLQLYKAALSKGKAYSDHKHHHVHQDDTRDDDNEDGNEQDDMDDPNSMEQTTEHPFLENGQLKPRLPVDELLAKGVTKPIANLELMNAFKTLDLTKVEEPHLFGSFGNNFIHFKRQMDNRVALNGALRIRRNIPIILLNDTKSGNGQYGPTRRSFQTRYHQYNKTLMASINSINNADSKNNYQRKRMLIIPDGMVPSSLHPKTSIPTLFSELDDHNIVLDDPSSFFKNTVPDSGEVKIEYEAAEWEVKKIGEMCGGCDNDDPFKKANILSWQETPKELFAGAEYVPAIPKCYIF